MKLCKDCKYIRTDILDWWRPGEFSLCRAPAVAGDAIDPVTGGRVMADAYCDVSRHHFGSCGPDGMFWEAKA